MIPPPDVTPAVKPNVTQVFLGQLAAQRSGILKAILGSCVGVCLVSHRTGVSGMAHCFLPEAPPGYKGPPARYADQAVSALLREMGLSGVHGRYIRAYLAGGASMAQPSAHLRIGEANLDMARTQLRDRGIRCEELDVLGLAGVEVSIDCDTQTVSSRRLHPPERVRT